MKNLFLIFIALVTLSTTLNAQWMELVTPTIDYEVGGSLDLEINLEEEPYLLYNCAVPSDDGKDSNSKLFVQKYNAVNEEWGLVGDSYINELDAYQNHLAIDSEGNVYVAFYKIDWDVVTNRWCTVKKFDGTEWTTIGEWNADGTMSDVIMYCKNQDEVYVSYYDVDTYSGPVVKKYLGAGNGWETLGDTPFLTDSQCRKPSITTDNYGNVLVAFGGDDYGGGLPLSVKKFNGSSWEYVGSSGFGDEPIIPTSIIVGNNDVVYTTTCDFWDLVTTLFSYQNNEWQSQYVCLDYTGVMPFAKYNNDVYMGHLIADNNYIVRIKKVDNSGNWANISEQPGQYFTAHPYCIIDIETDDFGSLYLTLVKGDIWNSHVAVTKLDITTGISEPQKESFEIYPNPSGGDFIIKVDPDEKIFGIKITNTTGETIYTRGHVPLYSTSTLPNFKSGSQINLTNHPKGVYFITIETNKSIQTKKIIIH